MLRELRGTRQIPGESKRRWFTSVDMDLIVWFDTNDKPTNFELCYDKRFNEKSLRFSPSGFIHSAVDAGEDIAGRYKSTPILRSNGHLDAKKLHSLFLLESIQLPVEITKFIVTSLESHTATQGSSSNPRPEGDSQVVFTSTPAEASSG